MKALITLIGLTLSLNTLANLPEFLIPKSSGISLSGSKTSLEVPHTKFILKRDHNSARVVLLTVPSPEYKTVCIKKDWREVNERNGDECGYDTVYEERCNRYCALYDEYGSYCINYETECHNGPTSKPRKCRFQKYVCVETKKIWSNEKRIFPLKFDLGIKLKKRDKTEEFLVEIKTYRTGKSYIELKSLKTKDKYYFMWGYYPSFGGWELSSGLRVTKNRPWDESTY